MSYIADEQNEANFGQNLSKSRRRFFDTALRQFDFFTTQTYQKQGIEVLEDLAKYCKEHHDNDKFYILMNQFAQWLQEDHLELKMSSGNKNSQYERPVKRKGEDSIRQYITILVQYFESTHHIETSRSIMKKRLKIKPTIKDDQEPFTVDEVRMIVDNSSPERKLLYMVLKDSGMRIGETLYLRKSDIDTNQDPIQINIKAKYTKEKKSHTTFITRETKPMLLRRLESIEDDELVFTKNENHDQAVYNEESVFNYLREKVGLTDRYTHSGRHKKTIHSFRSFTATQASKALDDNWSHALLGHKQYLQQYIRNKEEYPKLYQRTEPYLMIYEKIETIDSSFEVAELKKQMAILLRNQEESEEIKAEIKELRKLRAQLTQNV